MSPDSNLHLSCARELWVSVLKSWIWIYNPSTLLDKVWSLVLTELATKKAILYPIWSLSQTLGWGAIGVHGEASSATSVGGVTGSEGLASATVLVASSEDEPLLLQSPRLNLDWLPIQILDASTDHLPFYIPYIVGTYYHKYQVCSISLKASPSSHTLNSLKILVSPIL